MGHLDYHNQLRFDNIIVSFSEISIFIFVVAHLASSSSTSKLKYLVEEFSILESFPVPIHPPTWNWLSKLIGSLLCSIPSSVMLMDQPRVIPNMLVVVTFLEITMGSDRLLLFLHWHPKFLFYFAKIFTIILALEAALAHNWSSIWMNATPT